MNKYNNLSLRACYQLAAPHTWVSSIIPVVFAILLADIFGLDLLIWQKILLTLACISMQASVNTFNDYSDFVSGVDSRDDNVKSSDSTLVFGNINPKSALFLAVFYLSLGLVFGLLSLKEYKLYPISIGIVGAIIVITYSCGPLKLSYLPLGELVSGFVMGGLIPLAVLAVGDGKIHWKALLYSTNIMIGIGLIMMTNNACDLIKDKKASRNTLAVKLGIEKIRKIYRIFIILDLVFLMIFSIKFMQVEGFVIISLTLLLYIDLLKYLLNSKLLAKDRILQMKSILKFNLVTNGAYILVLILKNLEL
ncbi:MAG: UbiA family prenyltransferase [Peptoniphilaceae bacterium]|nr:UbiA family prenyltransferase [Peptoniphilaceae bacterium]MDY6019730.1 UbiA family prenyltransferase [Anaerococcus sp.]